MNMIFKESRILTEGKLNKVISTHKGKRHTKVGPQATMIGIKCLDGHEKGWMNRERSGSESGKGVELESNVNSVDGLLEYDDQINKAKA